MSRSDEFQHNSLSWKSVRTCIPSGGTSRKEGLPSWFFHWFLLYLPDTISLKDENRIVCTDYGNSTISDSLVYIVVTITITPFYCNEGSAFSILRESQQMEIISVSSLPIRIEAPVLLMICPSCIYRFSFTENSAVNGLTK